MSYCVTGALIPQMADCVDEDPDLLLHFPFDDHLNDVTCKKIPSVEHGTVELADDAARGKSAHFDGHAVLVVHFMENIFNRIKMDHFSVALWFKTDGTQQVGTSARCSCTTDSFQTHAF